MKILMRNVVLIVVLLLVMLAVSPAATFSTVASVPQFSVAEERQKLVDSDLQSAQTSSIRSTGFVKVEDHIGCSTSPNSPAIMVENWDSGDTLIRTAEREPNFDYPFHCKEIYRFGYRFRSFQGLGPNLVWHGPIDVWNPELGKWELKEGR